MNLTNEIQVSRTGLNGVYTSKGSDEQTGLGDIMVAINAEINNTPAVVLATQISGFVSSPGVLSPTDSILSAIEKLDGNIAANYGASLHIDGSNSMTANLNAGSNRIINVANPVNPQDAATMSWVIALPVTHNYGHMYGHEINETVTVSSAQTFYQIPAGLTGGVVSNFTFQNASQLVCQVAGIYKATWVISLMSGTAHEDLQGALMINGAANPTMTADTEASTANHPGTVCGTGIISLNVNDVISLCVLNETAAHAITVTHASMTLISL